MKRIVYKESKDKKHLYSTKLQLMDNKLIFIKICKEKVIAEIKDIVYNKIIMHTIEANNLKELKKQVKLWLELNGCEFKIEKRSR